MSGTVTNSGATNGGAANGGAGASGQQTIVFAGGATGGHLFPGIAVAEALKARGLTARVVFIGSARPVERHIVERSGFEHIPLPIESSAVMWHKPVRFANRLWKSARSARELLPQCGASLVVGLGGFASVPVVWAARLSGVPMMLLEQNSVPGRATSWLAPKADLTCLGFADAARRLPSRCRQLVTGNPVRDEISKLATAPLAGDKNRRLLVLGGSQGSAALNEAFLACVERHPHDFAGWNIVHQAGRREVDSVRDRYAKLKLDVTVDAFFDDLADYYQNASLAVARAGALTLSELACAGVPAVLVPYRKAVRNHQRHNAYSFEHVGAARIVRQSVDPSVTSANLGEELKTLLANDGLRSRMARAIRALARPNAASVVAEQVCRLLAGEPPAADTKSKSNDP
jgi:UDP-N-acetylglucosamine--N-acetylmuramyl-(pentapeptide) pyrophosphoryl-undecaprenol N-acetylglucosamine transferase